MTHRTMSRCSTMELHLAVLCQEQGQSTNNNVYKFCLVYVPVFCVMPVTRSTETNVYKFCFVYVPVFCVMPGTRPTENVYKFCFVYFPVFCVMPGTRPTEHHLQILFCLFSSVLRCARSKANRERCLQILFCLFSSVLRYARSKANRTSFTNSVLSIFQCSALCQEQGQQNIVYKFCFVYVPVLCIVPGARPTEHRLQILFCLCSSVPRCARSKVNRVQHLQILFCLFSSVPRCARSKANRTSFTNSVLSIFQCSALCQEQGQQNIVYKFCFVYVPVFRVVPGARSTEYNVYKFCFVCFPVFRIVPGARPTEHRLQILFCLFSSALHCARSKANRTSFTNSVLSMFQCSALCQEQGQQSRHVMCQLPDSEILEESNCDIGHRPADTRLCIGRCNASTNHWHERPWSSVSHSPPRSPTPRASTNHWHERPWSSVSRSPPHSPTPRASTNHWHERPWSSVSHSLPHPSTPRARVHNRHRQYTRTQIADPQANTHRWGRDRFVSDTTRKRIADPQANTHRWGRDRFVSDTTRKGLYRHHQQQLQQQQQSRVWRAHVDRIQRQQDLSRYFQRNMSRSERYNPQQTEYPHSYRSHQPRV